MRTLTTIATVLILGLGCQVPSSFEVAENELPDSAPIAEVAATEADASELAVVDGGEPIGLEMDTEPGVPIETVTDEALVLVHALSPLEEAPELEQHTIAVLIGEEGPRFVETYGLYFDVDGEFLRMRQLRREVAARMDCELFDVPPEPSTAAALSMSGVDVFGVRQSPFERRLSDFGRPSADGVEFNERFEVVATAGSRLFVDHKQYTYACGAHGFSTSENRMVDVRSASRSELYDASEQRALRERFAAEIEAATAEDFLLEAPHALTASTPIWTGEGWVMRHRFTGDACYACGDGLAGDYTHSVFVRDPQLPLEVAAELEGTEEAIFALTHDRPELQILGASRLDVSRLDAFGELAETVNAEFVADYGC